jgi:hypothetical protein
MACKESCSLDERATVGRMEARPAAVTLWERVPYDSRPDARRIAWELSRCTGDGRDRRGAGRENPDELPQSHHPSKRSRREIVL